MDGIVAKLRGSLFPWLHQLFIALKGDAQQRAVVAGYFAAEWRLRFQQNLPGAQTLTEIFQLLALLDDREQLAAMVAALNNSPPKFYIESFAPALLKALEISSTDRDYSPAVLQELAQVWFIGITKHFNEEPAKPATWTRAGSSSCSCELCQQLNLFLQSPELETFCIDKTQKRNLLHIQEMIDNRQLDVTGEIVGEKGEFNGRFSKNEASYLKALQLFQTVHSLQKQIRAFVSALSVGVGFSSE